MDLVNYDVQAGELVRMSDLGHETAEKGWFPTSVPACPARRVARVVGYVKRRPELLLLLVKDAPEPAVWHRAYWRPM